MTEKDVEASDLADLPDPWAILRMTVLLRTMSFFALSVKNDILEGRNINASWRHGSSLYRDVHTRQSRCYVCHRVAAQLGPPPFDDISSTHGTSNVSLDGMVRRT